MVTDSLVHTSKYLRLVCRSPKLVIGLVLFFCLCGWLFVWQLPNIYQSQARVQLDQGATLSCYLDYCISLDDMFLALLTTKANLQKVAFDNKLLLDVRAVRDRKGVLQELKDRVSVISPSGQDVSQGEWEITISYRDVDPQRSNNVLGSFLDLFVKDIVDGQAEGRARSLAFLDQKIERYSALLKNAEDELSQFKAENSRYEYDQLQVDSREALVTQSERQDRLNKLSRAYDYYLEYNEDLMKRREFAEARENTPTLRIVEAPRILPGPIGPDRPLLFALVFIGACALGIAASILGQMVRSRPQNRQPIVL